MAINLKKSFFFSVIILLFPYGFQFLIHPYVISSFYSRLNLRIFIFVVSAILPFMLWIMRKGSTTPDKNLNRAYVILFCAVALLYHSFCVGLHNSDALIILQIARFMYHVNTITAYILAIFLAYLCVKTSPHLGCLYLYVGMIAILIILRNDRFLTAHEEAMDLLEIIRNGMNYLPVLVIMGGGYILSSFVMVKRNNMGQLHQAE